MSHVVFWDQPTDVDIDATYTSAANQALRLEHSSSPNDLCGAPGTQDCSIVADPEFFTWFPTLDSTQWLLRPVVGSTLWNGALPPTDPSFDPTPIVGHAGGVDATPGWYGDADVDGLYDGWELHWFRLFPFYDLTTLSSGNDWDADSSVDDEELAFGTNPDNPDTDFDSVPDPSDIAPLDCAVPISIGCPQQQYP
jgi:hypothetical protein